MKIHSFVKRLNATELGLGETHDTYVAIPSEVDLSNMLVNRQAMTVYDRSSGNTYTPGKSTIKYVQTGQNNQERISGLGQYFLDRDAKVGDEILIESIEVDGEVKYVIDLHHRNAIVFQKNNPYVEILPNNIIGQYARGQDYVMQVWKNGKQHELEVKFVKEERKKQSSPKETKFYDLILDGESILPEYSYQDYIEIITDGMRLGRMKTYMYSILEMMKEAKKDE